MRKLSTSEFLANVKSRLRGAVDLSKFEYTGTGTKSTAICPIHGEFLITPNALMNGIGCKVCSTVSRGKKSRLSYEEFLGRSNKKHSNKYIYSAENFSTSLKKISIICPDHGEFYQTPHSHMGGSGCPECAKIKIGSKCKLSQEEFVARLESLGTNYGLALIQYRGMFNKITLVCPEHGEFQAQAGNVLYNGSGCPKCARESNGKRSRKSFYNWVADSRSIHGDVYEYLSIRYDGNKAYLKVSCKTHGEFEQLATDHTKGIGCRKCAKPMYDLVSFVSIAEQVHKGLYNYSKSEYTGALDNVTIICNKHGEFQQSPSSHINGQGCPKCANVGPSEAQTEIKDFLQRHVNVIEEYSLPGTRKRLDIFMPTLNLAVEYHGLIWHSSRFKQDTREDFKKHKLADSLGVRVIHVYEDEWKLKRSVVERTLLSAIGKLPRIFARSTKLVELSTSEADTFYEANHLQGKCMAEVAYGLTHDGELVACMSFGVARSNRKNTDKEIWELERYAATKTIVGGAGKLLSAFVKSDRAREIVSYSDSRAFSGNMYKALGFKLEGESAPDYKYTNGNYRFGRQHKSKYQRKNLPNILVKFDPEKSETENCRDNGLYQIFDCGKRKWVLTV